MTSTAFAALRTRLGCGEGLPVVAVLVATDDDAAVVRQAGGLPLYPPCTSAEEVTLSPEGVVAVDTARLDSAVLVAIRNACRDSFLLDVGPAKNKADALAAHAAGVNGVAVGSLGYGEDGGTPSDRDIVYALEQGSPAATAVVSGNLNAVRALGFFENVGHSDVVIVIAGADCTKKNVMNADIDAIRLAALCRREGGHVYDFLQAHPMFQKSFEIHSEDADILYPGWRL